ncbi:hypothetical protein D922_02496 [Enterococcus faecalis 06-MB-DW-09]|jgi:hypothetical protein|nr:hypothetical protein D922_02496 [Enterococcus faecalis 06-MB-DW-09]
MNFSVLILSVLINLLMNQLSYTIHINIDRSCFLNEDLKIDNLAYDTKNKYINQKHSARSGIILLVGD